MSGYNEEVALLVAQTGPLNGQQWPINASMILGRDETSDIVVPDRQVSRHHARISATLSGVFIEDLGSKNGTHCNGQNVIGKVLLVDGDVIQIALAQKFVFLSSDATLPLGVSPFALQLPTAASIEPAHAASESTPIIPASHLRIDKRSHRVWVNKVVGTPLQAGEEEILPPLSISQYLLLELLADNDGQVVSREALVSKIWGQEQSYEISEQALDALVRRLRERLASANPGFEYIHTVRGHGLRLENPTS